MRHTSSNAGVRIATEKRQVGCSAGENPGTRRVSSAGTVGAIGAMSRSGSAIGNNQHRSSVCAPFSRRSGWARLVLCRY